MVDVALFELEGVLFDTAESRRASLREALLAQGIVLALDSDVVDGLPPRAAVAAALTFGRMAYDDVMIDLVAHRAERAFTDSIASGGAALREGALDFFEQAASSARLAVVTRMNRGDAGTLLRLANLESVATIIVCADELLDGKPSPEGHRAALERLGRQKAVSPQAVIALEDGPLGIRAARAAGARCIAVGPLAPHVAMDADAYVPSLEGQTLKSLDALSAPGREQVQ
ncbi:MAG: family hydrolase [Gemmatimonadetes bacterium]|nr:family hydrolase [Gemmatimonadota bacterium]